MAKICLMLKPSAYVHVRSAETSKVTWENLKKAYEDKGLSRRFTLLRALAEVELKKFNSMELYIGEIMSIVQKLGNIGSTLDDELLQSSCCEDYQANMIP